MTRLRWWLALAALALGAGAAIDGLTRGSTTTARSLPIVRPHPGC